MDRCGRQICVEADTSEAECKGDAKPSCTAFDSYRRGGRFDAMERVDYSRQGIELLRSLAASLTDKQTRQTVLRLADKCERKARDRIAALELIRDRIADQ